MSVRIPIVSTFDPKGIRQATSALGEFRSAFQGATSGLDKLGVIGDQMVAVGKGLTRSVTLPLVAVGGAAAKMALDFESAFAQIEGLVGVAGEDLDKLRQAALELGPAYGQTATQAGEALFFITSAGLRGTEAIEVLEASLKASAVGLGDVATIADLTTSAINAYGSDVLSAASATDILTAAVREGKLEPAELAGAMGQVLPVASAMGVSFDEVGAAFAAMSRTGTNASQAATQLRAIMTSILKPTVQAEEALKEMGLSSAELRQQIRDEGLLSVLETLTAAFADNEVGAEAVFGNVRALSGVLDLMGSNAQGTQDIFAALADTTGTLNDAFAVTKDTVGFEFQQAMAETKTALMEFGLVVLPIVSDLALAVRDAATAFRELSPETQDLLVKALAITAVVGPLIWVLGQLALAIRAIGVALVAVKGIFVAVAAALGVGLGVLGVIILAIVAYVALMITWFRFLINNWEEVRTKAVELADTIQSAIQGAFDFAVEKAKEFKDIGKEIINSMIDGVKSRAAALAAEAIAVVKAAIAAAKDALKIGSPSKVFVEIGQDTVAGFIEGIRSMEPSVMATMNSQMGFDSRGAGGGGGGVVVNVQGAIDPEGTARTILRVLQDAERRTGARL